MESFPEEGCRSRKVSVPVEGDGVLDAIMLTWDLALHGEVSYSTRCAPDWAFHLFVYEVAECIECCLRVGADKDVHTS